MNQNPSSERLATLADGGKHVGKLIRPCADCPFSPTGPFVRMGAGLGRAQEIATTTVLGDTLFHCHKTVGYTDEYDEDGEERVDLSRSSICAGFLLTLEAERGDVRANFSVRLACMAKLLDPARLDRTAPHFGSAKAFVLAHEEAS